ncbi:MAG TPA: hypothetical protein VM871_08655 [Flavisolibacter sp.]|jgi:hypothetical protein|nr:hypothetical protein [Flavisolibacter sp.]
MEKQIKNQTSGNRSFARLLFTGLMAAGSFSLVQAQETTAKSPGAEIRYAGTVNDRLIFGVEFGNETAQPFTLEIKDGEGYVFYNSRFKETKFKRYFAIDKAELDKTSITIQLETKNAVKKQVFDINTTSRIVEEVSVVRL